MITMDFSLLLHILLNTSTAFLIIDMKFCILQCIMETVTS